MIANVTELGHRAKRFNAFDAEAAAQSVAPLLHSVVRSVLAGALANEAFACST